MIVLKEKKRITWVTNTAIFIALLIIFQAATAPLATPVVTGTIVNLLLIISVITCGFASGISVALVSPIVAKLFGIGPLWTLIPFIVVGNVALISIWYFIGDREKRKKIRLTYITATITAAAAKSLVLYFGIVRIAIPVFLNLPQSQAEIISNMFSIPQFITALAGGVLATILLPRLKKIFMRKEK